MATNEKERIIVGFARNLKTKAEEADILGERPTGVTFNDYTLWIGFLGQARFKGPVQIKYCETLSSSPLARFFMSLQRFLIPERKIKGWEEIKLEINAERLMPAGTLSQLEDLGSIIQKHKSMASLREDPRINNILESEDPANWGDEGQLFSHPLFNPFLVPWFYEVDNNGCFSIGGWLSEETRSNELLLEECGYAVSRVYLNKDGTALNTEVWENWSFEYPTTYQFPDQRHENGSIEKGVVEREYPTLLSIQAVPDSLEFYLATPDEGEMLSLSIDEMKRMIACFPEDV